MKKISPILSDKRSPKVQGTLQGSLLRSPFGPYGPFGESFRRALSLGIAISSAIAGSICCVGPLLAGLVSIGAGTVFVKFSIFRPFFLTIAIISLAYSFYMVYFRKKKILCENGKCEVKTPAKISKLSLWLSIFIIALLIAFPYLSQRSYGPLRGPKDSFGGSLSPTNFTASTGLLSVLIEIDDLDCETCFISIKNTLDGREGIQQLQPDFSKKKLEVRFDPQKIKVSDIVSLINSVGFKVKNVKLNKLKE